MSTPKTIQQLAIQPHLILDWDTPLQYTGLTDKNGKEIYEGDIVIDVPNKKEGWRAAIAWADVSFYLSKEHPAERDFYELWQRNRLEVIGNIYENPELLK